MLVINNKKFIISFILILVSTLFIIFIGMNVQYEEPVQSSIGIQNVFYWGLIVIILQLGIGISLLKSHTNLINNLKRVSRIGDISHHHSQKILEKMGSLGKEIEIMMKEQNEIVVLRSNRISALNTLVKILCDGYSDPVLITDVNGSILSLSNTLAEKIKKEGNELSWKKLSDLRPDIKFSDVIIYLEKNRLPWSDPEFKGVLCTPVFDKKNILNFCIWEFETQHLIKLKKDKLNDSNKKMRSDRVKSLIQKMTKKK